MAIRGCGGASITLLAISLSATNSLLSHLAESLRNDNRSHNGKDTRTWRRVVATTTKTTTIPIATATPNPTYSLQLTGCAAKASRPLKTGVSSLHLDSCRVLFRAGGGGGETCGASKPIGRSLRQHAADKLVAVATRRRFMSQHRDGGRERGKCENESYPATIDYYRRRPKHHLTWPPLSWQGI